MGASILKRLTQVNWHPRFLWEHAKGAARLLADADPVKWNLYFQVMPYTMATLQQWRNAYDLGRRAQQENVPGAYVECGVWKGGCAATMAYAARAARPPVKIWLFDSFEGLPEPASADGIEAARYAGNKASGKLQTIGECVGTLEDAKEVFNKLGIRMENVEMRKGWFQDTVPKAKGEIGPIALLRLDGDWYDSIKVCLENLYPLVVAGGYVIIDDYNRWAGCRKAVEEYFNARNVSEDIKFIDYAAVYFKKSRAG